MIAPPRAPVCTQLLRAGRAHGVTASHRSASPQRVQDEDHERYDEQGVDQSPADLKTRAVIETMRADEARHRERAIALGAAELPGPVKAAMRTMAKVMTSVAYRV